MADKLICPFCGEELGGNMAEPCCRNQNCEMNAIPIPRTIWEKLIQAKRDLEIATSALYEICNDYQEDSTERAEKALKQIEHKE